MYEIWLHMTLVSAQSSLNANYATVLIPAGFGMSLLANNPNGRSTSVCWWGSFQSEIARRLRVTGFPENQIVENT